jgi:hypothetical protein
MPGTPLGRHHPPFSVTSKSVNGQSGSWLPVRSVTTLVSTNGAVPGWSGNPEAILGGLLNRTAESGDLDPLLKEELLSIRFNMRLAPPPACEKIY